MHPLCLDRLVELATRMGHAADQDDVRSQTDSVVAVIAIHIHGVVVMTATEIVVATGGALLGYWVVRSLLGFMPDRAKSEGRTFDDASSRKSRQQEESRQENQRQDHQPHEEDSIPASWFRILEVAEYASKNEIATA